MNVIHRRQEPAQSSDAQRGRPRLYDDEQRKQRHREAALQHYHRAKARREPCFFAESGSADRAKLCTDLSTKFPKVINSNSLAIRGEC